MTTGAARVSRHLVLGRESVFARVEMRDLFTAYLAHANRWEAPLDALAETMIRQALGAATLHAVTRPPDETVAWTLNVHTPPLNLFFTARNADSSVIGRVFTEGVKTSETSRLFVETQRTGCEPTRSAVEVEGLDVLDIFEQYYAQSEQVGARFLELSEYDLLMVQGLPDVDGEWLAGLDRDHALDYVDDSARLLDVRDFELRCGCDSKRMLEVMRVLYAGREDDLFRSEESIEAMCPRCGHRWPILRRDFRSE